MKQLNAHVREILAEPLVIKRLRALRRPDLADPPEAFKARVVRTWKVTKVINDANISEGVGDSGWFEMKGAAN